MIERIITDANGRKHITTEPPLHPTGKQSLQVENDQLKAEIERLRRTLHNISLAAHDSGSTREGMGKEARAALEPLKPCTSDEWLANCPQSVRDLANKIKQEKK